MNLTEEEIKMLESVKSGVEWDMACDAVKAARNVKYPPDWWPVMKLSGRMDRIFAGFGESPEMTVKVLY